MSDSARDPNEKMPAGLLRFVDRFDRGEYWLSHEELEEVWMEDRRDCFKGLIHVAAALLHAERGNAVGARTKMDSAVDYLVSDPDCPGFDGGELLARVRELRSRLPEDPSTEALGDWAASREPLRPLFAVGVPEGVAPEEELPYRVRRHEQGYRTRRDPSRRD